MKQGPKPPTQTAGSPKVATNRGQVLSRPTKHGPSTGTARVQVKQPSGKK